MQRHRVLVIFGIAWLSAVLLSWTVYKKAASPQERDVVQAVAAQREIPVGKRLAAADLKLVTVDRKDLPAGAALKIADLVDRAVTTPISAHELVLERKLAAKGGGESLAALIEPGLRAVSVQVNEISGVAGFAQPGSRVDVLFTRTLANGDAASTTILQNVKVIAYGKQLEAGGKIDARTGSQTVATLLVTQEEAEKLALAMQRGRIQLALRNPLDTEVTEEAEPIRSADLGIDEPVRPLPRRAAAQPAPAEPETGGVEKPPVDPKKNGQIVIKVFRGSKVTEERFP